MDYACPAQLCAETARKFVVIKVHLRRSKKYNFFQDFVGLRWTLNFLIKIPYLRYF